MNKTPFYFGVDYYPEQWPERRWQVDAQLMQEAGLNVVRLAEFAWAKLEPAPGKFDFAWLDLALGILQGHGISAVLGTPTASPPAWLMNQHPEIYRVCEDGRSATYGNRCEYCPNSQIYQEAARRIVRAMAGHYSHHTAVIGWQIDNEMGERCYCPACRSRFQDWLQKRYGTLKVLNDGWGTQFWSHVYRDWAEIPLPVSTGGSPNPGLALDYRRFISDSYIAYQQMQVDILRDICPSHFITHNFMGFGYEGLNYYDLARPLDLVSWDNYPLGFWNHDKRVTEPYRMALGNDAMRGLKQRNYWVMEQQAGPSGWETVSPSPRPGELRLWAYQSIAHGADGVVFFRWRTARYGTEQYWHGLLDHHGQPGRRYHEIQRMGKEIQEIGAAIQGSKVKAQVAVLHSYDSRFAFQIQPNNPQFRYGEHVADIYQALNQRAAPVDVISPETDLSPYKLVVSPALHILTGAVAVKLTNFVQEGGTLVVTPRTGVKDLNNAVVEKPLPGLLAEACGLTVEEYDSLIEGVTCRIQFCEAELAGLEPVHGRIWCDILAPAGAKVLARYMDDYYAGKPAITVNQYGRGLAVYVGAFGEADLYQTLLGWLLKKTGVPGLLPLPAGVEAAERWQGNRRLVFILNHTDQPQHINLPRRYKNLLDGSTASGHVPIAPHEVLLLAVN